MIKREIAEGTHLIIETLDKEVRGKVVFDDGREDGVWHTISMEPRGFDVYVPERNQGRFSGP